MKKSLLLLALTSAFAGSAFAQTSSVSMYGVVDLGITHESGGAAGSVTKLGSGAESYSRIGFKGSEDLGNGLKALFQLEAGFKADTGDQAQSGSLFNRQSFIGLSSESFGTVTAGRQYDFNYETLRDVVDPFAAGLAGRANNIIGINSLAKQVVAADPLAAKVLGWDANTGIRTSNVVKYVTPSYSGVTLGASYGFGEVAGSNKSLRSVGLNAKYAAGPLTAAIAYNSQEDLTATIKEKSVLAGAAYDFGVVKAHVGVGTNKIDGLLDDRDYLIGVTVPVDGATRLLASYVRKTDRLYDSADASQIGVGVVHNLSKRTDVYASYAHISNDSGAAFTVGNNTDTGSGNKGFNVGLRHQF